VVHHDSQQQGPLVRVQRQATPGGEPRYEVHCTACGLVAVNKTVVAFATQARDRHWRQHQAGER
jgi:hypothetical protein